MIRWCLICLYGRSISWTQEGCLVHEFYTRIRSITDRLCCCIVVVKEIKIFFILDNYYNTLLSRMRDIITYLYLKSTPPLFVILLRIIIILLIPMKRAVQNSGRPTLISILVNSRGQCTCLLNTQWVRKIPIRPAKAG